MRQTVNIASTLRRRRLAPSWQLPGLEVRLAAESGQLATAAGLTASAAVAFGPPALRASDALTANRRRRRYWTVSCSKLPVHASLKKSLANLPSVRFDITRLLFSTSNNLHNFPDLYSELIPTRFIEIVGVDITAAKQKRLCSLTLSVFLDVCPSARLLQNL